MTPEDFEVVQLTDETSRFVDDFECSVTPPYTTKLVEYLKTRALTESRQGVSTTWLWLADGRPGAYCTLSATSVPTRSGLSQETGITKPFAPALMIDQIAVADFVRQEHIHLGYAIFHWVRREVVFVNRRVGCRFIRLDVQLGNWGAYRVYRLGWKLRALPAMTLRGKTVERRDGTLEPLPDPELPTLPAQFDGETFVKLWHDVYAVEGA